MVADDFVDDPRSGAAADDEDDVFSEVAPAVPEVFEGADEVRFGRVHPRQLVDEDDFLFVC